MERHVALVEIPEDIVVEPTAQGVRYGLPARQWPSRWPGWVLLFAGITLVAAGVGIAMVSPINAMWPIGVFLLASSAVLTGIGVLFCLWGQNTLNGRVDIVLTGETLLAVEVTGRLRWTRRRSALKLKQVHIMHEWQQVPSALRHAAELARFAYRIVLEYEDGRRRMLVKWYSRERLEPVARDLSRRLGLVEDVIIHFPPEEASDDDPTEQPVGSLIALEHTAEGLAVVIPPLGILRSEDGRSVTKLVGGGAMGAAAGMFAMVLFSGFGPWWIWAMFSVPAFAGVLFVTAGLLGQRDTYIDIVGDTMLVSTKGWRGIRQHQWTREQLKDIVLGESAVEINDEYLPQLHIIPKEHEPVQLLTGRRRDEILWLAHTLRQAMEIGEGEGDDAGD